MMKKREQYEDVLRKGHILDIYVQVLEQNVKTVCEASFADRNPYFRSKRAKQNLQALVDTLQQCQDAIVLYMAALANVQLCSKQEQYAYYMIYQFLFDFHDDIKKQEWMHLLLIRDASCRKMFEIFIAYTQAFIKKRETAIEMMIKKMVHNIGNKTEY